MSRSRTSALAAGLAAVALLFTACGDDGGGGRPSAAEIADKFATDGDEGLTDEQADCLGGVFADSDISDGGLRTLLDADDVDDVADVDISDADRQAFEAATAEAVSCATEGLDIPDVTEGG